MKEVEKGVEVTVSNDVVDPEDTPLGEDNVRAWLTVLGSSLVYFASFGVTNSFGFFQDYYQTHYLPEYPPSTIAFIGTLQISLMYVVAPIAGALSDIFGLKWIYPAAALGCCGSLIGLSFSQPGVLWQPFVFQGVLFGIAVAFNTQPALAVVGQHFKQRRALTMGIVSGASSISGSLLPIMLSYLVPKIGFGWAVRVVALLLLVCYLVAMAVSRTKEAPKPPTTSIVSSLLDFNGYKDPRYLVLAIGNFVATLGLYVPNYYIGSYALLRYPSASIHSYLLPVLNGSSFFGRILGGWAADQTGRLNLLYPMTILSGLLSFALWLPDQGIAMIMVFACLYGFTSGVFISVTPPAVAQILPDDKIGARIGAFFTLTALATLMGSPIAGCLLDESSPDGYTNMILFTGVTLVVGGGLLFLGRWLCDKDLRKKL
ncbi:Aspyridones efflux protein apdF [Lasiodiplodia hormozganensis]|uniref:Aspyridones efflux protein apdF n=1 Tax=Lasiodiplodia hormozganensis TaxID=869390 RepID=A0AA39YLD0_9PEZI|nr:Aspyridones efflux protein apdF [Lasiodiplodia hormozganensis]